MELFAKQFNVTKKLLVGTQGIALEEFMAEPVGAWL